MTDQITSETFGREQIREMVEENWRQFLAFAATGSQQLGAQVIARFDEKNKLAAAKMPPDQGKAFLDAIEAERDLIFDEYTASPEALKKRLGVSSGGPTPTLTSSRQGLGEVVVKTAVRASIWAAIWSLFR